MKKMIKKKVYNTQTAKEISRTTFGEFGDADGYEEILYETKKRRPFYLRNRRSGKQISRRNHYSREIIFKNG